LTKTQAINILKPIINNLAKKHDWIEGKKSLVMSQILLESGWLRHAPGNNCLGIKVPESKIELWQNKQLLWTKEWDKETGKYKRVKAWFMTYPSVEDCIESGYIKTLSLSRYKDTRESLDWWEATDWIKRNGYATSPAYTENLRKTILKNKLYEIDFRHKPDNKITENFKYYETFSNVRIGNRTYLRVIENPPAYDGYRYSLFFRVQIVRNVLGKPLIITPNGCNYRIKQYNAQVGGSEKSQHLTALAVDLCVPRGMTAYGLYEIFKNRTDINGFGIGKNFIHVDLRDKDTVWYY